MNQPVENTSASKKDIKNLKSSNDSQSSNGKAVAIETNQEEEVFMGSPPLTEETNEFFEGDNLRSRVFLDKYALRNRAGRVIEKTPLEMWARVAKELASVERTASLRNEWEEKFFWLLSDFRYIPGGRILFGAGNPRNVTLLNCYVIPVKDDRLESIFDWMKEAARTYSYGGGVGTDISILRPKGARVNNAALTSTGSVSFMDLFSLTTGTIGQSGRRGALMITMRDSHPDILDFCKVKRNLKTVRFANISVRVSDKLMKAVEEDGDFDLHFENDKVKVNKTVRAREVWNELIKGARDWAEPGLVFWDNIKKESTSEYNGMEVISTNPCVTGDTRIHTEQGLVQVKELYDRGNFFFPTVDNRTDGNSELYGARNARSTPIFKTAQSARLFKVKTDAGYEIKATDWHEFYVADPYKKYSENGKIINQTRYHISKKKLKDIKEGELLMIQSGEGQFGEQGYYDLGLVTGLISGNGTFGDNRAIIDLWNESEPVIEQAKMSVQNVIQNEYHHLERAPEWVNRSSNVSVVNQTQPGKSRMSSTRLSRILKETYGYSKESKLRVPEFVWKGTRDCVNGYLKGLFSADGSIWVRHNDQNDEIYASLTSANIEFLKEIQILLSNFGILCRIYSDTREDRSNFTYITNDGVRKEYHSNTCYSLRIHGTNVARFMQTIGFLQEKKNQEFHVWLKKRNLKPSRKPEKFVVKIDSIQYFGNEPVYDATQIDNHSLIFNGIVTGNCAEIPLEGYGDCCLGNINFSKFVEDAFTDKARVNWVALEKAARYGVRFLDNVLDYNADKHPLAAQTEASMQSRRIGLGFTGLGDMLCQMKLKYDTDESIAFVDNIFDKIKNFAYDESVNLGIEKGIFKKFDRNKHMKSSFIQRLQPQVRERIKACGLRNVAVLTVPPVGSGASLAGTTSGVEPIFANSYTRRSESLTQKTFKVYHPLVGQYMKQFNLKDESELPSYFVTSHTITAEKRVKMQATIQKHIDHAISSTVNLPRETTVEEVSDIYFHAWKMGCKGITVYREGSREGILITNDESKRKKDEIKAAAPKEDSPIQPPRQRPKVTEGRTERVETPRGPIYVTINEDDMGLCEIFVKSLDAEAEVAGRLASLLLRAGVDPREIMEQLWRVRSRELAFDKSVDGTNVRVTTVAQGIALVIGRYLYGDSFDPKKEYPRAATLPEPVIKSPSQLKLKFNTEAKAAASESSSGPSSESSKSHSTSMNGDEVNLNKGFSGICPDCGEILAHENGCDSCKHCGYTRCA